MENWLELTSQEKMLIDRHFILEKGKFKNRWSSMDSIFGSIYTKLKNFYSSSDEYCYYCRESDFVAHSKCKLDHIVPKANYPYFTFYVKNLVHVCDTCNQHKLNKDVFNGSYDKEAIIDYPSNSSDYIIIHPYFDNYDEHIIKGIFYRAKMISGQLSSKGVNTIAMCKLNREELVYKHAQVEYNRREIEEKTRVSIFKEYSIQSDYDLEENLNKVMMYMPFARSIHCSELICEFYQKAVGSDIFDKILNVNVKELYDFAELVNTSGTFVDKKTKKAMIRQIEQKCIGDEDINNAYTVSYEEVSYILQYMNKHHSYKNLAIGMVKDEEIDSVSNEMILDISDEYICQGVKIFLIAKIYKRNDYKIINANIEFLSS